MSKHCTTAVIECFLINAHHTRPYALGNWAELKHWQQFSISKCRELSKHYFYWLHNLLNLAVGFRFCYNLNQKDGSMEPWEPPLDLPLNPAYHGHFEISQKCPDYIYQGVILNEK